MYKTVQPLYCRHGAIFLSQLFIRIETSGSEYAVQSENSELKTGYDRSRSFKVIEVGTNRKPVCNFLQVLNSNLKSVSHRFHQSQSRLKPIARVSWDLGYKVGFKKLESLGYSTVKTA